MPKRSKRHSKRDYRAEYQRRVERGKRLGYGRSYARGHAPKGTVGLALSKKIRVPVGTEIDDITVKTVDAPSASQRTIKQGLKDKGLTAAEIKAIDVTDQETFVKTMLGYGFTYREAFDLFFGY